MDPFCIGSVCIELSLELGTVIVAAVGALATVLQHLHHKDNLRQRQQYYEAWQAQQQDRGAALPPGDLLTTQR